VDIKTLNVLEWPLVLEILAGCARTAAGERQCRELRVASTFDTIQRLLQTTAQCRALIGAHGELSFEGVTDLSESLLRCRRGVTLRGGELLAIASTLRQARLLKERIVAHSDDCPLLEEIVEPIANLSSLNTRIFEAFEPSGAVADRASSELAQIRNRMRDLQTQIRAKLQELIHHAPQALQEPIITIRAERFVLPVRSDAHGQIPGIVHDQSASGATLYVEPLGVVPLNNAWRQAELAEQIEVERILAELTELVMAHADAIHWTHEALTDLDVVHAKAIMADRLGGVCPELAQDGHTRLRGARHPVLANRLGGQVVPIDIALGGRTRALLITGPNTGGKTVTLKTLGLCVLMTQSGMHPPVGNGTQIAPIRQLFADIGDEQSLNQNLSTFSGHMTNLIRILEAADGQSLLLLDELGAGTDPAEGAALAQALIEAFLEKGATLAATTHYGELKWLRYQNSLINNAAVEFDLASLAPTYRLLMGVSGQSMALAIANRLGLDVSVTGRADVMLRARSNETTELMDAVIRDRHRAAELLERAQKNNTRAEQLKREYEEKVAAWREYRAKLENESKEKIAQQLRSATGEIAAIIRELQGVNTAQAAQKATERLKKFEKPPKSPRAARMAPQEEALTIGKSVFIPRLGQSGKISALPDSDGNLSVQVGILTVNVKLSDLSLKNGATLTNTPQPPRRKTGSIVIPDLTPATTCDLRGLLSHEAIATADKFLDDALRTGLREVTLIHGAGTGALRNALRAWLKTRPLIQRFTPGRPHEGGDGVTLVQLP